MSDDVYVAKESFVTYVDGERITVRKGKTRVRAGHALLAGREHLFKPVDVHYDVETARQEPTPPPPVPEPKAAPVKAVAQAAKKAVAKKTAPAKPDKE